MTIRRVLIILLLILRGGADASADDAIPTDVRVIEANALLGDEAQWNRAVDLYSSVLSDDPHHVAARNWLARLLAWKGEYDDSLAHYDFLVKEPNPPDDLLVERAEVLSWAGRYDEARSGFEAILASNPSDARAATALIRVYLWSSRHQEAEEAYERALEIAAEGPEETLEELKKLKTELRPALSGRTSGISRYFSDSDGFSRFRSAVTGHIDIRPNTRLLLGTTYTAVEASHDGPGLLDEDDAVDALFGLERRLGERLRVNARLGWRHWVHAEDRFLFRGEGEYTWNDRLATGIQVLRDDFLEQSDSLASIEAGLTFTSTRAWAWHTFNDAISGYGYLDVGFVSDANRRISAGVSYTYRPRPEWDLRFRWVTDFLTYTDRSSLYYDPIVDFSAGASVLCVLPLWRGFRLEGNVDLGAGFVREVGVTGVGVSFAVGGGPTWSHASGFSAALQGSYSRSQRATVYSSSGAWVTFGWGF